MKYTIANRNIRQFIITSLLMGFFFCVVTTSYGQVMPIDNGDIPTMGKGAFQVDTYYGGNGASRYLNTTLRYGWSKNYEFQLTWTGNRYDEDNVRSIDERATLGIKAFLNKETKWLPTLAIIANANLTMDRNIVPMSPSLNLLYDKTILDGWTVNGNYQVSLDEMSSKWSSGYSANLEADVNSWLNAYVGTVGNSTMKPDGTDGYQHWLEIGGLFFIANNVTLYPFYDIALDDTSSDIFNLGLLIRL